MSSPAFSSPSYSVSSGDVSPLAQNEPIQPVWENSESLESKGCAYLCGDCGAENRLRAKDPVRCRVCGYRILYKIRTSRLVQYEAR